jgi:2-polyprenyl-3-methyl-5-hydroxy-6-metoxy-1,4-benzoquinol methylase
MSNNSIDKGTQGYLNSMTQKAMEEYVNPTMNNMSHKLINLGTQYVSDFVEKDTDISNRKKYPLELVWNEKLGCPTLTEQPSGEEMWGKYWYKSGTNRSMKIALIEVTEGVFQHKNMNIKIDEKKVWLDIACNDGTLLSALDEQWFFRVGIDPIEDKYIDEARKYADSIVQDYFTYDAWERANAPKKADVVTSIAMFYDLQDPFTFAQEVEKALDKDGIWVIQLSYTPLMIKQLAFDNILGEHYAYHNLSSVQRILATANMKVLNAELNDVNGGSIRIYAVKNNANMNLFGSAPKRDVWAMNVQALFNNEHHYENLPTWLDFANNVSILRMKTTNFIDRANREGKSIWAYGASTKGNTLLQYFDLDNTKIEAIAERNPDKWGLHTIGTNIVIKSEEDMREAQPDYVLVLPWHFISEFLVRESEYLQKGGAFIVPCPNFKVYTKEDLK